MIGRESPNATGSWGAFLALILVAGIALALSMPWAVRLAELMSFPWSPSPVVFFSAYGLLAASVALSRGASLAPRGPLQWRHLGAVVTQSLFAHLAVVPYLVYIRILMPGREGRIPLVLAYAVVLCAALAIFAYVRQATRWSRGKELSDLKYFIAALIFGLPLVALFGGGPWRLIALLSPIGVIQHILGPCSQPWISLAFAVPLVGGLVALSMVAYRIVRWNR